LVTDSETQPSESLWFKWAFDLNECVILWTKIGDTYFFIGAESVKKMKSSFEKNQFFFSFRLNIVETVRKNW